MITSRTTSTLAVVLGGLLIAGCHRPTGDVLDRLVIGEVLMNSEFSDNLRELSVPGGRLSGTPNAEQAERFIAERLRVYGLQNVHLEAFDMLSWTFSESQVTLLTDPPVVIENSIAMGRSMSTPGEGLTADVVYLGTPDEEDFESSGDKLRGKFVVVNQDGLRTGRKAKLAADQGAAGLVVISRPERMPIIGNAYADVREEPVVGIPHSDDLIALLESDGPLQLNIRLVARNWHCRPNNVIGEIPGHGPLADEVIIISAHLDSWHLAEGGMDNGSGSATILETARALAAIDWRPRRTVRFIWFMGEEHGLFGSRAYVNRHIDELDNVVTVINLDMPGDPRSFGRFGHPEVEPFLHELRADLAGFELSEKIGQWSGSWSDHGPFIEQGVCGLGISGAQGEGVKHYHTIGDTYETVDRRGTVKTSAVLAVMVRRLADAADRLAERDTDQE